MSKCLNDKNKDFSLELWAIKALDKVNPYARPQWFFIYGYNRAQAISFFKSKIDIIKPMKIIKCDPRFARSVEKRVPSHPKYKIINWKFGFSIKGIPFPSERKG